MASLWDRLATTTVVGDDWPSISAALRQPAARDADSVVLFRHHPWLSDGRREPLLALEFAWLWTPETTMAFSLLMVVLALFLCCWISNKVGEFICTTMAGIMALSLLLAVLLVFVSQWW